MGNDSLQQFKRPKLGKKERAGKETGLSFMEVV